MSLYENFATNKDRELGGVAMEYSANKDGTIPTFTVTRMCRSNTRYNKRLEAATKPHRRAIQLETMDNNLAEKISMQVFVDTILLGWSNIQGRDSKVIPFSKSAAIVLFTDLPDLYDDLQMRASKASEFRDEVMEEEAKN